MAVAYAIVSVLAGVFFGLFAAAEAGLLWGAATYAGSGSVTLLSLAYLIAAARPHRGGTRRTRAA